MLDAVFGVAVVINWEKNRIIHIFHKEFPKGKPVKILPMDVHRQCLLFQYWNTSGFNLHRQIALKPIRALPPKLTKKFLKQFVRAILEQCKQQKEIKVIRNQIVTPTSALELSKCIASILETENYGLFHATCEGQCSWAEFAREIIHITKLPNSIAEVDYSEHNAIVKRPLYSVLTNSYKFPDWEIALFQYLTVDMPAHFC